MNMVWRLLWKDIRRFKWWLVAWFVLIAASLPPSPSFIFHFEPIFLPPLKFTSLLSDIFQMLFVISVVQEDALMDPAAFWRTRPANSKMIFSSKTLFIFLLIFLPQIAGLALKFSLCNITVAEITLICIPKIIGILILILAVWLAALYTRRLSSAVILFLVVYSCYVILNGIIHIIIPNFGVVRIGGTYTTELACLFMSKWLMQDAALCILAGIIIAFCCFKLPHIRHAISAVCAALIIAFMLGSQWNKIILAKKSFQAWGSSAEKYTLSLPPRTPDYNMQKPDPKTMAKEQAEVSARLAKFNWDTTAEVNFDDDDKSFTVKSSDPGLKWSVSNQCGHIAGTSALGKWAGCKIQLPITNDTRALIEISGDLKISKSSGHQLVALGCATKAGSICMFFEGEKGTGCMYYKDEITIRSGYVIQRRFIKIPVKMEKELNGFEFGNEAQAFHKMRIVLDRAESRIYYHADDQLLGILKYEGDIGTVTSIWMELEAREKNTELHVLYDNLRVRVAGETWDEKR